MSNQPEVLGGAVLQRLAKGVGLAVGTTALAASLALSAAPAWAQKTYSVTTGLPITSGYDSSAAQRTFTRTITVGDEFDVNDLSMQINMFVSRIDLVDVYLTDPSGAVTIRVLYWHCQRNPISFGTRTYANNQSSPTVTGEDDGIPATYTFADGGETIGDENGADTAGTVCRELWGDSASRPNPTWPTWTSAADRPLPASDWVNVAGEAPQSHPWTVYGAYRQLPTSRVYAPAQGSFSRFNGLPAKGDWTVRIDLFGVAAPNSWEEQNRWVNAITLNFDGGTGFSGKKAARAMVQNFMASRASRLLSDDLELNDMLKKQPKPTGNVLQGLNVANNQVTSARTSMFGLGLNGGNANQVGTFSVWAKSSYQRSENPSGDVDGYIGHVALGYQPSDNTALGILVTMDRVKQKGEEISGAIGAKVEGTGWLVGPYVVAKLDKRLTFTGRAQMGASDNTYEFSYGSWNYAGAFATKRVLVKAELAGETEVGRWLLEPSIKFGYIQDESKGAVAIWSRAYGYDDIGQVDVSEGRVELAQKVSYPINAGRFTFVPSLKVSGIWLFDSPDYVESISSDGETIVTSDERFAARVEAALQLTDEDSSASAGLSIFYEGTTTDHDAFGISLRGKIPLNK